MKYVIELEKIEGTDLYRAKGANMLVFDKMGIDNILTPYEEKTEVDWHKVPRDTKVLVWDSDETSACRRYFSHFDGEMFVAFSGGCTSWSNEGSALTRWVHCKLAEDEE